IVQRRSGEGDHRAHLGAARLRDELQGHQGRRRDGGGRHPGPEIGPMMRLLLRRTLLAIALLAAAGAAQAYAQETVLVTTRVIYPGETVTTDALEEVPLRRQLRNPAAFARAW